MDHDTEAAYWKVILKMTAEQKLEAMMNLYWTARELKAAGLRLQHPDLPEGKIQKMVRDIFLYAVD